MPNPLQPPACLAERSKVGRSEMIGCVDLPECNRTLVGPEATHLTGAAVGPRRLKIGPPLRENGLLDLRRPLV